MLFLPEVCRVVWAGDASDLMVLERSGKCQSAFSSDRPLAAHQSQNCTKVESFDEVVDTNILLWWLAAPALKELMPDLRVLNILWGG